jgi:hypothetical protein
MIGMASQFFVKARNMQVLGNKTSLASIISQLVSNALDLTSTHPTANLSHPLLTRLPSSPDKLIVASPNRLSCYIVL